MGAGKYYSFEKVGGLILKGEVLRKHELSYKQVIESFTTLKPGVRRFLFTKSK